MYVSRYIRSYVLHTYMYMYKLVLKQILKYWNNFGILMYFLVFNYLFYICACPETKHVQLLRKLNGGGEVSYFVLLVF